MIFLVVLLGATLMPLSLEVLWRTDTGGTAHVQPEVPVVERSGEAFVKGKDPYTLIKPHQHITVPAGSARPTTSTTRTSPSCRCSAGRAAPTRRRA